MHSFRGCWFVIIVFMIGIGAGAEAQTPAGEVQRDPAKIALIRQILTETKAIDLAVAAMETSLPAQRAANPRIPAVFWDRLSALVHARSDSLATMFVDIYNRHFSADDLKQLLEFYRSPTGRKLLAETPAIARESYIAGQSWGMQLGAEVARQLAAEGIQMPQQR